MKLLRGAGRTPWETPWCSLQVSGGAICKAPLTLTASLTTVVYKRLLLFSEPWLCPLRNRDNNNCPGYLGEFS